MKNKNEGTTSVLRNGGCSASYDSLVQGSSSVFQLKFCAENLCYSPIIRPKVLGLKLV